MLYRRRFPGFTLIELMIVVAVMALLSAVLVPWLLRARHHSSQPKAATESRSVTQHQLPEGASPAGVSVDLQLELKPKPRRVGLDVLNRYTLNHRGRYLFRVDKNSTLIQIPLPEASTSISELRVRSRQPDERWSVPSNLIASSGWLAWIQESPGDLEVMVDFNSEGQDRLKLSLPPANLHHKISAEITSKAKLTVPTSGLSSVDGNTWQRENILSPSPLLVELPSLEDPLTRVVRLFRLTGLAVLVFGSGFWYLSELYESGSLKSFGFGSFGLLALNYSLFFVSFAVLGFHELLPAHQNLALSTLLTAPILLYHVSQILDWRFAISRALPLSIATLGLVYNGVYGGETRDVVYLGYALALGTLLTLSYRPFVRALRAKNAQHRKDVDQLLTEYRAARDQARDLVAETRQLLETGRLRESQRATLTRALELQAEQTRYIDLPTDPYSWSEPVVTVTKKLLDSTNELQRELKAVRGHLPAQTLSEIHLHCLACGREALDGKYCCHCSLPLPEVFECPGCRTEIVLPRHLELDSNYHCHQCGHRHERLQPQPICDPASHQPS